MNIWNHLGFFSLRRRAADPFSKGDSQATNCPLIRPNHETPIDHAIESCPVEISHFVMEHGDD